MQTFAGKTVLITGASGTVGQACAGLFLERGAKVLLTDRVAPPANLTSHENACFQAADVTGHAAVNAAFEAGVSHFGAIDFAVLAAGIEGVVGPVEALSEADFDAVMDVNVKGSLFWMQACLRHMKPRGSGSIVALSSISGVVGAASLSAYTMSKHAVVGLVRAAALEAGRQGVRVNAVCPGPIDSPMMRRLDQALSDADPARVRTVQNYVPVGDVAAMVAFLCGDGAASCNGGAYMVDGGFTAR